MEDLTFKKLKITTKGKFLAIVGGIIFYLLFLCVTLICLYFCYRSRNKRRKEKYKAVSKFDNKKKEKEMVVKEFEGNC